jgi:hypothetical protein
MPSGNVPKWGVIEGMLSALVTMCPTFFTAFG